jgi:hypothetical protein
VANFDGQEASFSTIELEHNVEIGPLQLMVSTEAVTTPYVVTYAQATWKNAGRHVGWSIIAQDEVKSGDIIVQPHHSQQVVSDMIGDTPFSNYDLVSVSVQEEIQSDQPTLKVTFYTAGDVWPAEEPLQYNLYIDIDCNPDTGEQRRDLGMDYRIIYTHRQSRAGLYTWEKDEQAWNFGQSTRLPSLVGEKMVTIWLPYNLIENDQYLCWIARSRYRTDLFNTSPTSDMVPHWRNLRLSQYGIITPTTVR